MDPLEFRKVFLEEVRASAVVDGDGSTAAFVEIMANHLLGAEVLPDFQHAFYQGVGRRNRRLRVDGYVLDEFDFTMNLIVASYSGREEVRTLTRTEAEQVFELPVRFVDETHSNDLRDKLEISTPAYDLADLLTANQARIRKYRIILFSDSMMSDRIEELPTKDLFGVPVEYQIWDIGRIFKICVSDSAKEAVEIVFAEYVSDGLPCLEASNPGTDQYRCYLCVVPGTVLADIYDRYGAQLLEGNVRSFLSTKVAVNRKIRETILSEPSMFFAFNNGISATARDVVVRDTPEGKFMVQATDFQIINGGQTTASLSNARYRDRADLSNINLQMKLTEIKANLEETSKIIQKISRSSNTQNKVSDADFFSTHPFHVRMEQIARKRFAPAVGGVQYDTHWFYERARGQYVQAQMRMTKSERDRFALQNPKSQLITKTDLAKVLNTWRCMPHIVSRGAQANFMEFAEWIDDQWANSDQMFNERFFQECVALYILFKKVETLVSNQAWYQKGYRANIVTYAISLLSHLITKQFPNSILDLQIIWNRQDVPKAIMEEMVSLTKTVMESITDSSRETANVTQWCKREPCWARIKSLPVRLSERVTAVLISKHEAKSADRAARLDQKMVKGIEAQSRVVEYGAEYWKRLEQFVREKRLASPEELTALRIASQMPDKLPNAYQCERLMMLVARATTEGYKG